MTLAFCCPACGAAGTVDAALAGRTGRCRQCNHRFTLPTPGATEAEAQDYALAEPVAGPAAAGREREPGSTFVRARGEEKPTPVSAPASRPASARARAKIRRDDESDFAWWTWLLRGGGVAVLALVAIALVVPDGPAIVGRVLLVVGSGLVLLGFGAGAYGAFREDLLYGVLYLAIPFYAAYYLVTRWDDLWTWFAAATLGVGLVLLGTQILRATGAVP